MCVIDVYLFEFHWFSLSSLIFIGSHCFSGDFLLIDIDCHSIFQWWCCLSLLFINSQCFLLFFVDCYWFSIDFHWFFKMFIHFNRFPLMFIDILLISIELPLMFICFYWFVFDFHRFFMDDHVCVLEFHCFS